MTFTYSAINKQGVVERDQIEAASYKVAIDVLHQKGLIPTEVRQKQQDILTNALLKISGVSLQDKILFIKNLSIMLKAGLPLTKGLKILSKQTHNPRFKKVLEDVSSKVESGKSFAEALDAHRDIFQNIFVSMVRVGELSGNLDKNLEYLSIQLQREHDLISKTKGAMIYPAVIVIAIVIIGLLMTIFVLPGLIAIFKEQQVQLPLMTRMVVGFVDVVSNHPILVFGGIVAVIALIIFVMRTQSGQRAYDKTLLVTPIFGEISKKVNMARFSRIMSSMLKSGTPILEGLQICGDSMGNSVYRETIARIVQDVRIGKTMSESMSKTPKLFSYLITQMIGVGEESGNLSEVLEELAIHFEEEVDETMRNLSSIIEPVLILGIGIIVGVLAIALIGPIYSITQSAAT